MTLRPRDVAEEGEAVYARTGIPVRQRAGKCTVDQSIHDMSHQKGGGLLLLGGLATAGALVAAVRAAKTNKATAEHKQESAATAAPSPPAVVEQPPSPQDAAAAVADVPRSIVLADDAGTTDNGDGAVDTGEPLSTDALEHDLVNETLPCSASDAFERLFDDASPFLVRFKEQGGGSQIGVPTWRRASGGAQSGIRELSFVQAVNWRNCATSEVGHEHSATHPSS